jgi:hypothetical protein
MFQNMVNSGGCCCVDCLPTAQADRYAGYFKIWNVNNCVTFGDTPLKIEQCKKHVFMDLTKALADWC